MKEQQYTLLDDYYFDVLRAVVEAFENSGYSPIIVGGVAVQAHLLALLGFDGGKDRLRKTDDYDLVVLGIEEKGVREVMDALNGADFMVGNAVFSVMVLRNGFKRPVLKIGYFNSEDEIKSVQVYLNIFTKLEDLNYISPEKAELMYKDAVDIKIKHSRSFSELKARVLTIEDLISTKLANGREKDYTDVGNLVNIAEEKGVMLDWHTIEENLRSIKDGKVRDRAIVAMRSFKEKPALTRA